MSEDITQDPEYRKGYEEGARGYNRRFSPKSMGYDAGWEAAKLASQNIVDSKAVPAIQVQAHMDEYVTRAEFEQFKREIDERLKKLEAYYARYTQQ